MQKASLTALKQFFSGFSAQGMLQIGDAFEMSVSENSTVDRVVGDPHWAIFIAICHVYRFNSVGQNGEALSLDQTE